ncbi:unnamed protein product, partial [Vitis vinifera]|uniref:Uncharacterized protein n=1 Tax=Vitis vinifera TaxID=29760 RepID=D7U0J4_VITVI
MRNKAWFYSEAYYLNIIDPMVAWFHGLYDSLQFFVVELRPYFSFTFLSLLLNLLLIYPLYRVTGNSGINMLFGMLL